MAEFLHFSRDSRLYMEKDGYLWSIPVLDGFSFSQATNSSEITLNEMEDSSGRSRRGRKMFTDSLSAAEWSFSTYIRPFKSTGNSGSSLTYAPPTGFSGQDTFSYTITDEDGLTDDAVVTISIFDYIPGGLAGLVYIDADGDGVQDANELVLGGIRIHLTGTTSDGASIDLEMLTSEQGLYEFTDLQSGSYTVTQTQPSFLVDGGFQGAAPDITFSSNSYSVELAEGQEISDGDFTEKGREASTLTLFDFFNRPAPPTLIGSFGDTVEEQWIAAHPAWVDFQDTSVSWDSGSHTLVVDVVRDDDSTDYGVLSPEAGDGIRQVTDEADTAVIFVTGLPDTYGIESQATVDGGDGVPESEKVPDFSLEDVNTTSTLLGTNVSPRDYEGNVTAFYFGLATCSYCTTQFGHLNTMQNDFTQKTCLLRRWFVRNTLAATILGCITKYILKKKQ